MFILVPGWKETIKFGAINCAQQSVCGNYSINGTPTLRLFYGGPGPREKKKTEGKLYFDFMYYLAVVSFDFT